MADFPNDPRALPKLRAILDGQLEPQALTPADWAALVPLVIWLLDRLHEAIRDVVTD